MFYETKGGLGRKICWYNLVCVAVDKRHWHARIGQPNLHLVFRLRCKEEGKRRTAQGASGVLGLTSLPARWGKYESASLSAVLNLSMSKISGIT